MADITMTDIAATAGAFSAVFFSKLILEIIKRMKEDNQYKKAIEALRLGVEHAQLAHVRGIKTVSMKLTDRQIKQAQIIAYQYAVKISEGDALELLEKWGFEIAKDYICRIVDARKDKV